MFKFDVGQLATLACILEISAPKPGNVSRCADFPDMNFEQMLSGAVAIGPAMRQAATHRLGETVLEAVRATRNVVHVNTNLGTILLLAPLASIVEQRHEQTRSEAIADLLGNLTASDASHVYEAIRLANPGGMGSSEQHDVHAEPPQNLIEAMRFAASIDLIAAQYANNFAEFFGYVVPTLRDNVGRLKELRLAIVHSHLQIMAEFPDSLVRRKRGQEVAQEAAARAAQAICAGEVGSDAYTEAVADFDFWLRADENARNPGTTADFIAAGLFVLLQDGVIAGI